MEARCPYCGEVLKAGGEIESFICPSCGSHVGLSGGTTVLMRTGVIQDTMVGQTLGAYRIKRLIGCGGMGKVYLAEHQTTERQVALKVLSRELSEKVHFVERFMQEARAAARLLHPNIVAVFEAGTADGYHFIAMEFVDGKPLSQVIFEQGRLPEQEALRIARQIASALAYAHRQNVVHRDIKPANILLTKDGVAKIADMGIAKRLDAPGVTMPGTVMGTPYYMAPEQATDSSSVDARADLYSLGATLYHAITGKVPFEGATAPEVLAKLQIHPLAFPSGVSISPPVKKLITRLMEKDIKKRIQTAEEAIAEIDAILGKEVPAAGKRGAGFWVAVLAAVLFAFLFFSSLPQRNQNGKPNIERLRQQLEKVQSALREGRIGAKMAIESTMKVAREAGEALEKEIVQTVNQALDLLTGEVRSSLEGLRVEDARKRVRVRLLDYGIVGLAACERRLWQLRGEVERMARLKRTAERVFRAMEQNNRKALQEEMFPLVRLFLGGRRKPFDRLAELFYQQVMGRKWKIERVFMAKPNEVHILARSERNEQQRFLFVWASDRWYLLSLLRKSRWPLPGPRPRPPR